MLDNAHRCDLLGVLDDRHGSGPTGTTNHPPYRYAANPVKLPIPHVGRVRKLGQSGPKGETRLPDLNFSLSPFGSDEDGPFLTNR